MRSMQVQQAVVAYTIYIALPGTIVCTVVCVLRENVAISTKHGVKTDGEGICPKQLTSSLGLITININTR